MRLLSAVAGNGATLYLAAVLISMEILVDLLEPPSDVSIAETQFSGVHLAGVAWHELKASSEVGGLLDRVGGSLEAVGRQMSAGMCSRHTCVLVLRVAPADGSAYGNVLYLVDLAEPSLLRESQVGGLSVDDYCSVNTTLKVLSKCLGAMGSRRKQPPPLRDSKLTHLLAPALGDDTGKVHALVYVEQPRRQRREAAAAVAWAAKAGSARLKKGTYASSNSKALVAQLQGVLAQLDFASEEMRAEMREQTSPTPVALEKLRGAQAAKVNALDGKAADKAAAGGLSVQLEANVAARHVAVAQRADVEAAVADLRDQVAGVRSREARGGDEHSEDEHPRGRGAGEPTRRNAGAARRRRHRSASWPHAARLSRREAPSASPHSASRVRRTTSAGSQRSHRSSSCQRSRCSMLRGARGRLERCDRSRRSPILLG